jgi:hypothetical protein
MRGVERWRTLSEMRFLALFLLGLAAAAPASAGGGGTLRVDRPQKGAGAKVTSVHVLRGAVHARHMRATVLSDTRCNPDANGVSHCVNRMRLADGSVITVQHDHRMMSMPCLSPGEHVVLTPQT